ncbi:autotransporter outer membrane beta-barrel domain-containing protein [Methyloligella sp. 2.7D]|uniref:autotransporter family protein n=1 Tax=unclassified Methyloligella TaxID=2625955 RepID=UPI00157C68E8|nr:autotransporter outer membrane beta-barrel domain-containing protein [Methyloligella sp. GL2]QKP77827.1 autotransporter outer membrane beta-barrel domain-containing protein [Methyloligella sp. GL2]
MGAGNYSAYGLFATTDGTGETYGDNRDTIETSGESAHGIFSDRTFGGGSARAIAVNKGSVTTSGDGAYGVHAVQGSGIYSAGPNTGDAIIQMETSGSSVTTTGANAYGLYAYNFSTGKAQVGMTGGTVTVSGTDSIAVSAYGQGGGKATLGLSAGRIVAKGDAQAAIGFADRSSLGTSVATDATVTIGSGMTVDGSGTANGYAIWNGDDRAATKIEVTSHGTVKGHAMMGGGDSTFTLAGGSYTGNIYGDYDEINGSPSDTVNQGADAFVWTGGSLHSGFYGQGGNDTATISVGTSGMNYSAALFDGGVGTDTITFTGADNDGVVGGNITNWEKLIVNGANIAFTDNALTLNGYSGSANGVGDFTVQNGGSATTNAHGGNFSLTGNLAIADANSTFLSRGKGTTSIAGDVTNAGLLSMQDGTPGGSIAIRHNYTGKGGKVAIDTVLGGDGSPTDRLQVSGNTSGKTGLFVVNQGGTGAQTSKGIRVVDVRGQSSGDFTLANPDYVIKSTGEKALIAGAYGYALRKDGKDWYLQSRSTGGGGGGGGGRTPHYQPATAVYEVYAPALLATMQLPTMRQRIGSRWDGSRGWAVPALEPGVNSDSPLWVRAEGTHAHREPTTSTVDVSSFDQNIGGFHAGLDAMLHEDAAGNRLIGMLTSHYINSSADIEAKTTGNGKIDTDGYGFGLTATWLQSNGVYVDTQSRFSWFESDLSSDVLGSLAKDNGDFAFAFSGEIGKELPQSGDWTYIPQVQLTYASVSGDSFTGPNGERISVKDGDSLTLRTGIASDKASYWTGASGGESIHAYGIANLYYDFESETLVNISGAPLTHDLGGWAGEIGLGLTRNFSDDKYSLFGEVNTATGLENFGDSYLVTGKVGAHIYW